MFDGRPGQRSPVRGNDNPDRGNATMGTRSYIGIENGDGTISGVYCHWDGYPPHVRPGVGGVGETLLEHYNDPNRVRELIGGGALSSLQPAIEPGDGVAHNFDEPADGVCIYYHRDRGEPIETQHAADRAGWDTAARICGCEYVYLLTPKGWKWKAAGVGNRWRVLRAAAVTA